MGGTETNDQFGYSLAAGDINGDFTDDLAVGTIGEDIAGVSNAGVVQMMLGSSSGLVTGSAVARDGRSLPSPHTGLQADAQFGEVLAIANFNDDIFDIHDLVVGIPRQNIGKFSDTGLTAVYEGSLISDNFLAATPQTFTLADLGSSNSANDHFGGSYLLPSANTLTIGDVDLDNQDDLIIGTPEEDIAGFSNTGLVSIRFGIPVGVTVLTPTVGTAPAETPATFTLTWTHPARWRDLTAMHLRWRGENGVVLWLKYDEESNEFSLLDPATGTFGAGATPGSDPEGRELTLTLRVVFKTAVSNHTYDIEQMVQDDHGNNQGFDKIGRWGVGPFHTALPIVTKP